MTFMMPNDDQMNFQACISVLESQQYGPEDAVLSTAYEDHRNSLKSLDTVLSKKVDVSPTDVDRILKICLWYTSDMICILYGLRILGKLIIIVEDNPLMNLLPYALTLLDFLNTKCHGDNASKLRILCLRVLKIHPKSTLIKLIRDHSPKVIQTLQQIVGLNKAEELPSIIESFNLLLMLAWLPPYEKRLFLEAGLTLWFTGVIPAMIQIVMSAEDVNKIDASLTCIELLVKELVLLNYYEHPHWKSLLKRIAHPKLFPASIMGLLENGKDNWHRIWIMLIKILKSQLTQLCSPCMSPLNSLLPIVESAFKKKEAAQRVRAFACWNELIAILSHECGNFTEKRMKLLMLPLLKPYDHETEETAVAKFETCWYFIHKFRPKLQKFTNKIIISFLQFMFGCGTKHQAVKQFQASQVSDCLRKKCIDAFAEIMHDNCSNCAITSLKRLDGNITTTIMLTDYWKDFVYALKSCIRAVALSYTKDTKSKIQCIWISFVMRLAAMTDTLRQDMFDDLINILSELMLEDEMRGNEYLMEILVDDITLPLWRDNELKTLTESRSQSHRPMHRFVKLIMDDQFNNYFKRFNSEELTILLQPPISTLLEESISTPEYIIWLLDELPVTNSSLVMWTALAQASKEAKLSLEAFSKILLWPFKTVHVSFEVKEAAEAWYTLYNIIHENLEQTDFESKISKVLTRPVEDNKASNYFVMFALIGVLKHKPDAEKMAKLEALTYEMNDYNDFEQLLIPLVNTIELMINNSFDENVAQITINCAENILKVIKSETEAIGSKSPIQNREKSISNLRAGSDTLIPILKTYLEKCPHQSIKTQVRSLLPLHDKTESPKEVSESPKKVGKSPKKVGKSPFYGWDNSPKELASPRIQKRRNCKNKETSIETTAVENVEEHAVVDQPNKKKLKPNNDEVITTDKQENGSPVISPRNDRMRQKVYTPRIEKIMNLACTPVSKTQKDINLQLSAPQTPVDRPARLKRTIARTNSLQLAVKKQRFSKHFSEDLLVGDTITTIAQIHEPNDKMDVSHAISPQTVSPKTSTKKPTLKSTEKPSSGEVPSNLSKASEDLHNDAAQNETYDAKDKHKIKSTLSKPKKVHKTPVKKVGAQPTHTPNISPGKEKSNVQIENAVHDENAAVNTPATTDKDFNQPELSVQTSELNDTDPNRPDLMKTLIDFTRSKLSSAAMPDLYVNELAMAVEIQTDEIEVSTISTRVAVEQVTAQMQTEVPVSANTSVHTIESGCKKLVEIVDSGIFEWEDFLEKLKEELNKEQVQTIARSLSAKKIFRLLMKKDKTSSRVAHRVLKRQFKDIPKSSKPSAELAFLKELLLEWYEYEPETLGSSCMEILHHCYLRLGRV